MRIRSGSALVGYFVLTGLAVCFSASLLSAQTAFNGKFTLPFETHWGPAVLPAGDYSVVFNSFGERYVYIRQGTRWVATVAIHTIERARTPARSQLLVVHERDKTAVHILYIDELRRELHFSVPEQYEVYTRLMTRVSEPVVIERIPVSASGK